MPKKLTATATLFLLILYLLCPAALAADPPLSEQTIVFLGDSITGNYEETNTNTASIPYLVGQFTGAAVYNCGFGNCALTERNNSAYGYFSLPALARSIAQGSFRSQAASLAEVQIPNGTAHVETLQALDWNKVDILVIGYGANDYTAGVPLNSRSDPHSVRTIQGALRYSIQTIEKKYPHIQFLLCSVHPRFDASLDESGTYTYTEALPTSNGHTLADYTAAVEAVAREGGHLFADLYHIGITEENAGDFFHKSDGLHPALPGRLKAAEAIAKTLGCAPRLFPDIPVTSPYFASHCWAVREELLPEAFVPSTDCTRGEALSFLWEMADSPIPVKETDFSDISADADCAAAVSWAVEQGITQGTTDTTFSPERNISRAHAVTFLWRLAGCPTATQTAAFTDTHPDGYYIPAMSWAVEQGIVSGYADGTFAPGRACTHAQIITFLHRYAAPKAA